MIPISSPKWSQLSHAYGDASDIPQLLTDLEALPPDEGSEAEPYFSLWSALCHQGDVYTASYAALPHLVRVMVSQPERVPMTLLLLVACIEIARQKGQGPAIPVTLESSYQSALEQIPEIIGSLSRNRWNHWFCGAALSAIAASKGFHRLAEAILELDAETIEEVLRSKFGEE